MQYHTQPHDVSVSPTEHPGSFGMNVDIFSSVIHWEEKCTGVYYSLLVELYSLYPR